METISFSKKGYLRVGGEYLPLSVFEYLYGKREDGDFIIQYQRKALPIGKHKLIIALDGVEYYKVSPATIIQQNITKIYTKSIFSEEYQLIKEIGDFKIYKKTETTEEQVTKAYSYSIIKKTEYSDLVRDFSSIQYGMATIIRITKGYVFLHKFKRDWQELHAFKFKPLPLSKISTFAFVPVTFAIHQHSNGKIIKSYALYYYQYGTKHRYLKFQPSSAMPFYISNNNLTLYNFDKGAISQLLLQLTSLTKIQNEKEYDYTEIFRRLANYEVIEALVNAGGTFYYFSPTLGTIKIDNGKVTLVGRAYSIETDREYVLRPSGEDPTALEQYKQFTVSKFYKFAKELDYSLNHASFLVNLTANPIFSTILKIPIQEEKLILIQKFLRTAYLINKYGMDYLEQHKSQISAFLTSVRQYFLRLNKLLYYRGKIIKLEEIDEI